ncbi:MAG: ubiquinol-cytochrome c reductase iron-sulfur subunit [Planctomycetota bacterium]|nr:ubiquinol-cytochrome c reductase iron-sulfur subunit [Planctomycetota bacterium]
MAADEKKKETGGGKQVNRRGFLLSSVGVAWIFFTGAMGAGATGLMRYMFPNVLFEPPQAFKAGVPEDYAEVGMVYEQWKAKYATWIVRNEEGLYALSTVCTHLGCTPNWLAAERKFKCPCHGSGFRKSGVNFEGPAPRPLERWGISLGDDGLILVDKGKKFQAEKGEWDNPEAFCYL